MTSVDRSTQMEMRRKYKADEFSLARVRSERDLDKLTQLSNRGFGEKFINEEYKHFTRHSESDVANFGLAYIDVDNFKMINDKYLDSTGDEILRIITSAIKQNIRSEDLGIRWGGDEFIVMLRGGGSDELRNIFFGKGKLETGRNIYDGINQNIAELVGNAIGQGSLRSDFVWPMNGDQEFDGRYISAGFVCASEASSVRALIDRSTTEMKMNKKMRKAGR